ncbi:selenium-dependent molybdenum cofactor biosynthesis protein YqeB [Desulfotomaculum copahuensis]|nr:selenium-dependent molybdenum cofactor biosynthesis protein YqeB [Desulfotomaculum copahuensis]
MSTATCRFEITPQHLILIKGAGEMATGCAHRLWRAGFPIVMTELPRPLCVRRTVSFAQTVYTGRLEVEGVRAVLAEAEEIPAVLAKGEIPVVIDPAGELVRSLRPWCVVDARLAKVNPGTRRDEAQLVIGLGPGFTAGEDVHAVIETARGHYLGRVIYTGPALTNTGVPGEIAGKSSERVLRATGAGTFRPLVEIGAEVKAGQLVAWCGRAPVTAAIDGLVRGMLHPGLEVSPGLKVGDIDPRGDRAMCRTISEKARAIGGGVLEAVLARLCGREPAA